VFIVMVVTMAGRDVAVAFVTRMMILDVRALEHMKVVIGLS
jgi:hypothetical protein